MTIQFVPDHVKVHRVLHITDRWENGGVESLIASIVRSGQRDDIEYRVLSICSPGVPVGGLILEPGLTGRATLGGKLLGAVRLGRYLDAHPCDAVHIHTSNTLGLFYAQLAKRRGIAVRIVHSHNSALDPKRRFIKAPLNWLGKRMFRRAATHRWACSREAGEHLFDALRFDVIKNGIDVDRFRFDPVQRRAVRERLGVPDGVMVVGTVARLTVQKNPLFLIDVFAALREQHDDAMLLIVGDGELRDAVRRRIAEHGAGPNCMMVGYCERPEEYLNAMDVYFSPSLFEGLPVSLVEAQANGLGVIASDVISGEAALGPGYHAVPLDAPVAVWTDALTLAAAQSIANPQGRAAACELVVSAGFSIDAVVSQIESVYVGSRECGR